MSGGEFCSRAPLALVLTVLAAAAPAHASFTARTSAAATFRAAESFAPRAVEAPSISGTPIVGAPLVADVGTWSPQPDAITVRWELGGVPVATGDRYTPTAAGTLRIVVTASRGSRTTSAAAAVEVAAAPAPVSTAPPSVAGTPSLGAVLTGGDGSWTHLPTAYTRTWLRCAATCTTVATGPTHTVAAADIGYALRYRVTASNGAGSATAESAPTAPVAPAPLGTFSASGLAFASIRPALTTPRWTVNPALPVTYAYEWWRCPDPSFATTSCSRSATTSSYTLTAADAGSYVRARHVATQNGVTAAQVTNAIGPVELLPPLLAATVTTNIAGSAPPAAAADGQTSTVWTAGATQPGDWVRLDFGAVRTLAGYEASHQTRPLVFEVSVDALTWTPIPIDPPNYLSGPGVDLRPLQARYLRLRVTTDGPVGWDVFDIRVWGS